MDEPISSLDFGNQSLTFRMIRGLSEMGKTVFFITHNPNHVIDMGCDIMVINNGDIEDRPCNQLLTFGVIRSICGYGIIVLDDSRVHHSFFSE